MFNPFRLVGGTSLSLQCGHRMSDDIDLFTDQLYGSIDFNAIDQYMQSNFAYCDRHKVDHIGFGRSYYVGPSAHDIVKVDMFYTDEFIRPVIQPDAIRLATIEEIIAMKLEIFTQRGRKKDFWDIHELTESFTLKEMLALHAERYPHAHDPATIKKGLRDFSKADEEFDPKCLRGKYWELIRQDILEFAGK